MKKTLLFSSLFLCVGSLMAQTQHHSTVEEMMRQHRAEELKRHGITDIDEVLTDVRSRLSKEMRDGKVFIVVGDKTYTLDGQLVK